MMEDTQQPHKKKPTTLYLTPEAIDVLKLRGYNISQIVDRFLVELAFGAKKDEFIATRASAASSAASELLVEHAKFFWAREAAKDWHSYPGGREGFLRDTAKRFGLEPAEVLKRLQALARVK